ncbi:MAG: hypothetical protein LBC88_04445 [Spirochaetaceae bacterium]|nr:hypothetical protein [Spirochaetaceae bacterium]
MSGETSLAGAVYQAVPGFEDHLVWELSDLAEAGPSGGACRIENRGPLYWFAGKDGMSAEAPAVFWAANTWLQPFRLEFDSISRAANALRAKQRNWAAVPYAAFRRTALIAENLPPVAEKPRPFPWLFPERPMGAWTLLDAHTLIGSARCANPFPAGRIAFEEDHAGPPSRAYLKLWEALVRARRWPLPGERCLDAGASPGGWSWALAALGAEVIAVDRAGLDERVFRFRDSAGAPLVRFTRHDAFTLKPEDIGRVDWLFCDVVCYPGRLYRWIEAWLASGLAAHYVCTIKMQGTPGGGAEAARPAWQDGIAIARELARIPGSTVTHLHHNRHELTWIRVLPPDAGETPPALESPRQ